MITIEKTIQLVINDFSYHPKTTGTYLTPPEPEELDINYKTCEILIDDIAVPACASLIQEMIVSYEDEIIEQCKELLEEKRQREKGIDI